ncbi:hypothetical protein H7F20_11105 [Robiginitalea sp. SC105]|nr:hypothetical protein [Robiginitalea sp. SC105]
MLTFFTLQWVRAQDTQAATDNCNCCTDLHRAFDFWIGDWEVTGPTGSPAGTNRIERIQGGCVLQEHWVGAGGANTGTSLNFYNARMGVWEQLWVDNTGSALKLSGGPEGGRMVMSSEPFRDTAGNERVHRITWTPREDGTVRQHWEVLQDGKTVQTLFDGVYRRKQ